MGKNKLLKKHNKMGRNKFKSFKNRTAEGINTDTKKCLETDNTFSVTNVKNSADCNTIPYGSSFLPQSYPIQNLTNPEFTNNQPRYDINNNNFPSQSRNNPPSNNPAYCNPNLLQNGLNTTHNPNFIMSSNTFNNNRQQMSFPNQNFNSSAPMKAQQNELQFNKNNQNTYQSRHHQFDMNAAQSSRVNIDAT